MIKYEDFDKCYHDLSRLVFAKYDEYRFYKHGSTYYLDDLTIRIKNNICHINISKINYTFGKWKVLNSKYIDFKTYNEFRNG